jgi:hypothetical protein
LTGATALIPAAVGATSLTALPLAVEEPLLEEPFSAPAAAVDEPATPKGRRWKVDVNWRAYARPAAKAAAVTAVLAALAGVFVWSRGAIARYRAASHTRELTAESSAHVADARTDAASARGVPAAAAPPSGVKAGQSRGAYVSRGAGGEVGAAKAASTASGNPGAVGGLQVDTSPSGARVFVDGRDRGVTPLTLTDLAPGSHKVVLESEEGSVRRTVQVVAGQIEVLSDAIFAGWLHIAAPVDVAVSEQGRPLLMDARQQVLLKAGEHNLLIESRSFGFSEKRRVYIEPGATTTVDVEMGTSTLSVTATAAAEVTVDGVRAGSTPLVDFPLKLGTHDVVVTDIFGNTWRRSVRVTSAPARLEADFGKQ